MTNLDNRFFNEYKHLDKLLRDCYATENGVSSYIEMMESKDVEGRMKVSGWQHDFKELKHLRYVRNKLAHETTDGLADEKDIDSVVSFQVRITSADDPLARLEKEKRSAKKSAQTKKRTNVSTNKPTRAVKAPQKRTKQLENDTSSIPILLRVIFAQLAVLGIAVAIAAVVLLILG